MIDNELNFEQVYASFQPRIHRYLIQLIGAKEAEDLTQEVFIKVSKALKTFRNESSLSTWLYRIATNAAIDRMKHPTFCREAVQEHLLTAGHNDIAEKEAGLSTQPLLVEEKLLHKETSECIRGIIDNLPDNYRIVVILKELEGLKNKEIAEILGVSLDVVKVRLHRGKVRLKRELLNYCDFSWDERNEFTCDPKGPGKK